MDQFAFSIGQKVTLALSGEGGEVIGRAAYAYAPPSYQVRYVDALGCQREAWFEGGALA